LHEHDPPKTPKNQKEKVELSRAREREREREPKQKKCRTKVNIPVLYKNRRLEGSFENNPQHN